MLCLDYSLYDATYLFAYFLIVHSACAVPVRGLEIYHRVKFEECVSRFCRIEIDAPDIFPQRTFFFYQFCFSIGVEFGTERDDSLLDVDCRLYQITKAFVRELLQVVSRYFVSNDAYNHWTIISSRGSF